MYKILRLPSKLGRLIYSLILCLRYLPLKQAVKVPICFCRGFKIIELHRGNIILKGSINRYMVQFGSVGSPALQALQGGLSMKKSAILILRKHVRISKGTVIRVEKLGTVNIGNNFFCNNNCYLRCAENTAISFGDNVVLGWNITLNTTDGHFVYVNGQQRINSGDINIGNHVWLASFVNISKGVTIVDDCVVAQNSMVTRSYYEPNSLIGGIPAKVIKNNVVWKV